MGDNVRDSQGPEHRASYKGCGNEGPLRSYAQGIDRSVRNVFRLTSSDVAADVVIKSAGHPLLHKVANNRDTSANGRATDVEKVRRDEKTG